jgi:phytoene/squalene synthetase
MLQHNQNNFFKVKMDQKLTSSQALARKITWSASKQTYYTILFLADRELIPDAYRAYAYFRWVDDCLDDGTATPIDCAELITRQQSLLEACYQGQTPGNLRAEERMLADLIASNPDRDSGLEAYLRNMMAVMAFDVARRERLISKAELSEYSRLLATAVTEALHYFIGHNCPSPGGDARYLAVRGAHVIHMLRDWQEDVDAGYFNIPGEYVQAHQLTMTDKENPALRDWVHARVHLARSCFRRGREAIAQVKNIRCRLAGFAYVARFEWMLNAIVRDNYHLRSEYPERKSWQAGLWMLGNTLQSALSPHRLRLEPCYHCVQLVRSDEK